MRNEDHQDDIMFSGPSNLVADDAGYLNWSMKTMVGIPFVSDLHHQIAWSTPVE